MEEVRTKKLRQVQALLDKADDPASTPAEADALRQKADDLMLAYAIEQYEIDRRKDKNAREQPTKRMIHLVDNSSVVAQAVKDLGWYIADHCRLRAVYHNYNSKQGECNLTMYGFPSDIDYAEMLFTSLRVQMSAGLEPTPDPNATFVENLVLLKEAGVKWTRIAEILEPNVPWVRNRGVQYTAMYTKFCKDNNRVRMYTSPLTFQRNYAQAFVERVNERLVEIKMHQKQQTSMPGVALVLRDRQSEVDAFFSQNTGKLGIAKRSADGKFDAFARGRGVHDANNADLGQTRMGSRKELT
jgi:hypothetical protein